MKCYKCKLRPGTSMRKRKSNGEPLLICKPCRNTEMAIYKNGHRSHALHFVKNPEVWNKSALKVLDKLSLRA